MGISLKTTPRFVSRYMASLSDRIQKAVIEAESQTIDDAEDEALNASTGLFSLAHLAAVGHPYSVRAPQPTAYPPDQINEQDGVFSRSWSTVAPRVAGNVVTTRLVNTDPKKIFLFGKAKMVPRPIALLVRNKISVVRRKRLTDALRKALKK